MISLLLRRAFKQFFNIRSGWGTYDAILPVEASEEEQ